MDEKMTTSQTPPNEECLNVSTSWSIISREVTEVLDDNSDVALLTQNAIKMQEEKKTKKQESDRKQEPSSTDNDSIEGLADDLDNRSEDVSDGISIISDCDSTGRLTPCTILQEHSEQNLRLQQELPTIHNLYENDQQQIRLRQSTVFGQADSTQAQDTLPIMHADNQLSNITTVADRLPSIVKNGVSAVFYVGATLAILAFIGVLRNPKWNVLDGNNPMADIEQRLDDLQMQNNILRAKIDIMSKQLLHLNTIANEQIQDREQSPRRKTKTRNGSSMDPLDVAQDDLECPYKCSDGKCVEIPAMCVKSKIKSKEYFGGEPGSREKVHDASNKWHRTKHYQQDHSKEHSTDSRSKERYNTSHEKSKKRFRKQHSKEDHGQDDDSSSGEWHERMMKDREHSRQKREKEQNDNWYIERGGSREQKRSND